MSTGTAPNAKRLLWAGFMSIFAAGVGFSVRAGILGLWGSDYGFTQTELGGITGGGLTGFGVVIIIGSLIADRIGYGKLMCFAFLMHVLSAAMQLGTGYIFQAYGGGEAGKNAAYWNLFIAMFLFSIANGTCEVVVNPMTATLFPKEKTHYLNILHAGWPGGLVAGGLLSYFMNGGKIGTWAPLSIFSGMGLLPEGASVPWVIQMSMFLIPVFIYGGMLLGQRIPRSEAAEAGLSYGTMFAAVATPVFGILLLAHALVGYVELGTDSWIAKITGAIMQVKTYGLLLFVYTSLLMFALRFFAGPIVEKISPLGLLFVSGILGCVGLVLLGNAGVGAIWFCVLAATVYACGKTFLWPTMLAVASERFPKGGAIAIGALGGAGMLSAGLLGGPGIGFKQDYFATQKLTDPQLIVASAPSDASEGDKNDLILESQTAYDRYAAEKENDFLFVFKVRGLDGSKTGILDLATTPQDSDDYKFNSEELERRLKDEKLNTWWTTFTIPDAEKRNIPSEFNKPPLDMKDKDKGPIDTASLFGGQMALQWTAIVPAAMAVLYLLLILYFMMTGGYKAVGVHEQKEAERGEAGTYGEEPPQTPQ